jgi:hypothetical protein
MFWKKKKKAKKPSREEIIKQATQAAASKREEIGEETLDQIRDAIMKKESSALEQAKRRVKEMDDEKVRDNLRYWMREE